MKDISYVDKLVFQDFRQIFDEQQKMKGIQSSAFADSFQFPGKIASNWLQILNLRIYKYRLKYDANLYAVLCCVRWQVTYFSRYTQCRLELYHIPDTHSILFHAKPLS